MASKYRFIYGLGATELKNDPNFTPQSKFRDFIKFAPHSFFFIICCYFYFGSFPVEIILDVFVYL
ncbi:16321_t:CDS:1, partial [Gigaspora margarita]